jgi:hypothetical protein
VRKKFVRRGLKKAGLCSSSAHTLFKLSIELCTSAAIQKPIRYKPDWEKVKDVPEKCKIRLIQHTAG